MPTDPTPVGGEAEDAPRLYVIYRSMPQNFSAHRKSQIFLEAPVELLSILHHKVVPTSRPCS